MRTVFVALALAGCIDGQDTTASTGECSMELTFPGRGPLTIGCVSLDEAICTPANVRSRPASCSVIGFTAGDDLHGPYGGVRIAPADLVAARANGSVTLQLPLAFDLETNGAGFYDVLADPTAYACFSSSDPEAFPGNRLPGQTATATFVLGGDDHGSLATDLACGRLDAGTQDVPGGHLVVRF